MGTPPELSGNAMAEWRQRQDSDLLFGRSNGVLHPLDCLPGEHAQRNRSARADTMPKTKKPKGGKDSPEGMVL